jgi:hypothetical protein
LSNVSFQFLPTSRGCNEVSRAFSQGIIREMKGNPGDERAIAASKKLLAEGIGARRLKL